MCRPRKATGMVAGKTLKIMPSTGDFEKPNTAPPVSRLRKIP
jgi:hypothetical protein